MLVSQPHSLFQSKDEKCQQVESEGNLPCEGTVCGSVYVCLCVFTLSLFLPSNNLISGALPVCVQDWFHLHMIA